MSRYLNSKKRNQMNRMNPIDMMMIIDVEYKNTHIYEYKQSML